MNVRHAAILVAIGFVVVRLVGVVIAQDGSRATGCGEFDWPDLQPSDPAYGDAVDFAGTLSGRGFVVMCIAPSKMTGTFEEQHGAALYKTNHGAFDVLFLPQAQDYGGLQVLERQANGRYLYSFAGWPTPRPATLIDASRPVYFVKHLNRLIVAYDTEIAARLGLALR